MKRHPATRGLKGCIQRFLSHSQVIPNLGRNSGKRRSLTPIRHSSLEAKMSLRVTAKLRMCAAVAGSCAMVTLGALAVMFTQNPKIVASGGSCHHQGSAGHHRPRAAVRRRGPELQSAGRYSLTVMIVPYARPNVLTI